MIEHGNGCLSIANDPDWPNCGTPIASLGGSDSKARVTTLTQKIDRFADKLASAGLKTLRATNGSFNWFWQGHQFFILNGEVVCCSKGRGDC